MEEIIHQIVERATDEDYSYHAYDFEESETFTLSANNMGFYNMKYYSLVKDLEGLFVEAERKELQPKKPQLSPLTHFERQVLVLQFGKNPKKTVLFTGGIHGREWMAVEMPYLIAEYLIKNYPYAVNEENLSPPQKVIKDLLDNRCIVVMPMLNPDGHHHSVFEEPRWRGNRRKPTLINYADWAANDTYPRYQISDQENDPIIISYNAEQLGRLFKRSIEFDAAKIQTGIDLNRNFEHKYWGHETYQSNQRQTTGDPTEVRSLYEGGGFYFGPTPNSEKETQAIVDYINTFNSKGRIFASIDYHSYGKFIIYPEYMYPTLKLGTYLSSLITTTKKPEYKAGTIRMLYPAYASMMDYCYSSHKISAYTIELDPAQLAPFGQTENKYSKFEYQDEVAKLFQPNRNTIKSVFEKNIRGALALISSAGETKKKTHFQKFADWNVVGRGNQLPE